MCISLRPYYPIVAIQHGHVHCKLYSEVIDVHLNPIEHHITYNYPNTNGELKSASGPEWKKSFQP